MNTKLIAIPIIVVIALAGAYVLLNQQPVPRGASPSETTSSSSLPLGTTSPKPSPLETASSTSTAGAVIKYKTVSYVDTEGIGTKAFSMLIPTDWQSEGSVNWILDNPAMPATGTFRAWNPSGTEEFAIFPNQALFWSDNPLIKQTFPPGTRYFGALVHTPLGPVDALKEIVLPLFRSNVENLKVVSEQEVPELTKSIITGTDPATGVSSTAEGGKIRVEYSLNGVKMEDEMYCVIQSLIIPIKSIYGTVTNINWYVSYIESFRAEKGKLDPQSKIFQTIAFSAKVDPSWLNKYNQVVNYLIQKQIQQIQSIGQLSSIISQTSNEISDENMKSWEQNQNIKDRLATDFSNNILGIQTYNNPIDGNKVDLPSGYSSAWTNSLGEYILSDSPSYNPNIGSNLNWQQMTP